MSEQPPNTALGRLLAEEAMATFPDDLDLWPALTTKLATRQAAPHSGGQQNWRRRHRLGNWGARSTPPLSALHPADVGEPRRYDVFLSAAAVVGLIALAFALFAIVRLPPSGDDVDPAKAVASPIASTPLSRHCDVSLDTLVRSDSSEAVLLSVRAQVAPGCPQTSVLRLQIVDAAGKPVAIAGNPVALPFATADNHRVLNATVAWANWCGQSGRFRAKTLLGNENGGFSIGNAPSCQDKHAPSTLRPSATETTLTPTSLPVSLRPAPTPA